MANDSSHTAARSISKEAINGLPLISWEGRIEVLDTIEAMEPAVESLLMETNVLGFDTETRPTFKKGDYFPPALIQFANETCVYLFRISQTKTLAPLLPLLESETVLKAGIAIRDDVKALKKEEDFSPQGFVEITQLTTQLGYTNRGLRGLAGLIMQGRISKGAQVSNWAQAELQPKQIRYAATDAWISRELYLRAIAEMEAG